MGTTPDVSNENTDSDLEKAQSRIPTDNGGLSRQTSRRESVVSKVRSRRPTAPFSHRLTEVKTGIDVIIDFDGPDNTYR